MNWLKDIPLNEAASAVRRSLSPPELASLQRSIEHFALISDRPVVEIAERVLCSTQAMLEGEGSEDFMALLADIIEENEGL